MWLIEGDGNRVAGFEGFAFGCDVIGEYFDLDLVAAQNANELGYAGGVAFGAREIVSALTLLLGVEVALIAQ